MKTPADNKSPKQKRLIIWGVILVLSGLLIFWLFFSNRNYALDIADGIGSHLIRAGAIKKCDVGNGGRGIDNREPWVQSFYEIAKNKDESVALMKSAVKEEGFTRLIHASPGEKGFLDAVGDQYIDNWYFDGSRDSKYSDLQPGKIRLATSVDNESADLGQPCEGQTLTANKEHTVIMVYVVLPSFAH